MKRFFNLLFIGLFFFGMFSNYALAEENKPPEVKITVLKEKKFEKRLNANKIMKIVKLRKSEFKKYDFVINKIDDNNFAIHDEKLNEDAPYYFYNFDKGKMTKIEDEVIKKSSIFGKRGEDEYLLLMKEDDSNKRGLYSYNIKTGEKIKFKEGIEAEKYSDYTIVRFTENSIFAVKHNPENENALYSQICDIQEAKCKFDRYDIFDNKNNEKIKYDKEILLNNGKILYFIHKKYFDEIEKGFYIEKSDWKILLYDPEKNIYEKVKIVSKNKLEFGLPERLTVKQYKDNKIFIIDEHINTEGIPTFFLFELEGNNLILKETMVAKFLGHYYDGKIKPVFIDRKNIFLMKKKQLGNRLGIIGDLYDRITDNCNAYKPRYKVAVKNAYLFNLDTREVKRFSNSSIKKIYRCNLETNLIESHDYFFTSLIMESRIRKRDFIIINKKFKEYKKK